MDLSLRAKSFISVIAAGGAAVLFYGMFHWHSADPVKFVTYLIVACAASRLKVKLPGITGSMSVNFLFILLSIVEFSLAETLVIGLASFITQYFHKLPNKPQPIQIIFNLGSMALSIGASYYLFNSKLFGVLTHHHALLLVIAATSYFVANTMPVATVISLTENKSINKVWSECYFWSFPYYLLGASVAGVVNWIGNFISWQVSLLVLPAVYLIYRSYRLYLGKLENEKLHAEDLASLHLRTIEALALAIEAKDQTTHDHLQRVRVYAIEVAKLLDVAEGEMKALHAAALLHDIGKLAVPEHIISKPGRLTAEEFEKMKIHPVVGAEILERVRFPYPVVPIVRAHHEKYNGTGYPDGLTGEQIPIGARILSAVDFLDALASDRQYRRALPMEEAMSRLEEEGGKAFDPKVVDVLKKHYRELEKIAEERSREVERTRLSTDLKVERGAAPATGFEEPKLVPAAAETGGFLHSIAAARQEAQTLFELSHDLGNSLSLDETLSVLSVRLKRLIPFDSIAIYVLRDQKLIPEHVNGDNFRLFSSLQIPLGEGLSGWVAQNRKPIINGNPSVEPGYLNDPTKFSTLRSALAIPLEGVNGVIGVLALYKAEKDSFSADHLRILLAISSKVALSIENALKFQQAESSATTDYLTDLPNARSLFLHLDRELARCKRSDANLTVMVCDLDGFKQVNDRFGHLEGNRVLRLFARRIREACREYDYVARMGGDEFVMVAPGLTAEAAGHKAQLLAEIAREIGREVTGEDILSLSVGKAVYPEDGLDAEQLLAESDRRMYLVKQEHHLVLESMGVKTRSANVN